MLRIICTFFANLRFDILSMFYERISDWYRFQVIRLEKRAEKQLDNLRPDKVRVTLERAKFICEKRDDVIDHYADLLWEQYGIIEFLSWE